MKKNLVRALAITAAAVSIGMLVGLTSMASHIYDYQSGAGCPYGYGDFTNVVSEEKVGCCYLFKEKVNLTYDKYRCYASCPAYGGGPCYERYKENRYNYCQPAFCL